jgi:iron complex transport system substrate-binding protein
MKKVLVIMLCMIILVGCGTNESAKSNADISNNEKVITDQTGRQVAIPDSIDRIATGRILPFPAVYFLATESTDKIVGIHPASKSAAKTSMLGKLSPSILDAQTNFIKGGDINVEELLKLNTDIVFVYGDKGEKMEIYDKANIKTVGIKTMSIANGNSIETLNSWLELLGQITDQEERAKEIIGYGRNVEKEIKDKLESVESKPRGLMLFTQSDGKNIVSGKGFFGNYWLNATGAVDVAENDIKIKAPVDMEQIYAWNPEVLYITNFTELQPEDFYNNTIEGQDWSQIDAVKNKRVYKIPLGIYRWFPPSGDSPLMLQWLAKKNHPDLFTYDMNEVLKKYYRNYYGYELSEQEVELILNPSDESAKGYND